MKALLVLGLLWTVSVGCKSNEDVPKAARVYLRYKDVVKFKDGFLAGCEGTVVGFFEDNKTEIDLSPCCDSAKTYISWDDSRENLIEVIEAGKRCN